ncbi:MAG TPA: hypothetical protein VK277_13055 [Acidimicrobiales bacterium]|nr:hypothetical protein [Acidimicrobiales bacterium]
MASEEPTPQPMNPAQAAWAAKEEGEFAQVEQGEEADVQRSIGWANVLRRRPLQPGDAKWNPIRRFWANSWFNRAQMDRMSEGDEAEVSSEIASGRIEVPAGGPVTPEEEFTVLEHPWEGHTEQEAIERLREGRAKGEPWPPPPDPPAAQ